MDCRIARCLSVLKKEFAASALRGDLRLVKVVMPLKPVELPNQNLDWPLLGQIQECACQGRYAAEIEPWNDDQKQIQLILAVEQAGGNAATFDRYVELSAAAVRCLGGPVQVPKDFELAHLPATDEQDLMRGWTARLLDWAIGQENPLLHASRRPIDHTLSADGQELFTIGPDCLSIPSDDASRLAKLHQIISGGGYVLELQTSLLRASVFGIEHLLQEACA